jgi:hypothetical protein
MLKTTKLCKSFKPNTEKSSHSRVLRRKKKELKPMLLQLRPPVKVNSFSEPFKAQ